MRPAWTRLYEACSTRNPFLSYEWNFACLRHESPGNRPFVLTAHAGGRLVGIAPLRFERRLGLRTLRFIGDGRSDYLGFIVHPEYPGAESALLEGLGRLRQYWDLAILRQLTEGYTTLHTRAYPESVCGRGIEGTVAPYLTHDGPWESLVSAGPGWIKRMLKASRKWEKEGGTVRRITGRESADYVETVSFIESRSWKKRQGVARFQPGRGQELLRETLAGLGARGEMELWLAWMKGEPAAFQINFVTSGRICLYQGAYDETYRKFSPGGVVDCLAIQRAWQDGAREYDFMSGDEPYKAERTDRIRSLRYLALYPATLRGRFAFETLVAPRWRLKGFRPAQHALSLWMHLKNNPLGLIQSLGYPSARKA
jgi:CelD/BcsL family acetyltransferase involved in cellulose biosynthesis